MGLIADHGAIVQTVSHASRTRENVVGFPGDSVTQIGMESIVKVITS